MKAANDNVLGVPPGIYTMEEAAAFMKVSRRKMQDLVKTYPFYALNGNRKLFSQAQIEQLYEAMTCRKDHISPSVLAPIGGTSVAPTTAGDPYSNLRKRRTAKSQKPSSPNIKRAS